MVAATQRAGTDCKGRSYICFFSYRKISFDRECIIGITRDPQFGPMVMFGLGGIFVELLIDVKFAIAPVSDGDALNMIKQIKTYQLLSGYRGQKSVAVESIADTIVRISQLAIDFPEIKELDINPFMAFPDFGFEVIQKRDNTLYLGCSEIFRQPFFN